MSRKLIAFTAGFGEGKSSSIKIIENLMEGSKTECKRIKMADKIYEIQFLVYNLLGLPITPDLKDGPLLLAIGKWGRGYNKTLWLDQFTKEFLKFKFENEGEPFLVLNDDVRFDNEALKIREMGGIVIKVTRDISLIPPEAYYGRDKKDETEQGISSELVDYFVDNNGTLDELEHSLREILVKEGVL